MKIFVVVVTFNGQKWINNCFGSLLESSIPVNVIVIDNGSNDKTCELIEEKFPWVSLIKLPKNLGFGKANNIGIRLAIKNNADYVVLLNQDAWVEEDTIKTLVDISKKYEEYGILSCLHLDGEKRELDYNFSLQVASNRCPNFISDMTLGLKRELYEIEFVNAAFWFITRRCIENVGLFDSNFFMYGEDDNYIHRVKFNNYRVGITPYTSICHDRKYRKKQTRIAFKEIKTDFFKYILNPNNTFVSTYLFSLYWLLKKTIYFIVRHQVKDAIKTLSFFIQSIFSLNKFLKIRKSY